MHNIGLCRAARLQPRLLGGAEGEQSLGQPPQGESPLLGHNQTNLCLCGRDGRYGDARGAHVGWEAKGGRTHSRLFASDLCLPVNPFCLNATEAQMPVKQASAGAAQSTCAAFKRPTKRFYAGLGSRNILSFCHC